MANQTVKREEQTPMQMVNGLDVSVLNETVRAISAEPSLGSCRFRARNTWQQGSQNTTTISSFYGAGQENTHKQAFVLHADEPPVLAGHDDAPNPVEHLLNALAGCMTTSLVAHAAVRGIHIEAVESELEGDIDLRGFLGISPDVPRGYSDIRVTFRVKSDAEDTSVLEQFTAMSPVLNTLVRGVDVKVQIEAQ